MSKGTAALPVGADPPAMDAGWPGIFGEGLSAMSDNKHESVVVAQRPSCDLCKYDGLTNEAPAVVDGKTTMGPWANMCERHFGQYGVGLGLGRGQRLIVENETVWPTYLDGPNPSLREGE